MSSTSTPGSADRPSAAARRSAASASTPRKDAVNAAADPNPSEAPSSPSKQEPKKENVLRRLYHWVLGWADTPYGTPALGAISFAESSFFPIPPDVLQIALSVSRPKWSYYYALVNSVCSVLGGIAGYAIGMWFWGSLSGYFLGVVPGFTQANFDYVQGQFHKNAFLAVVAAAFTPIPYKVFTIAAGVFSVDFATFVLASIVGRSGRFFLVATCIFFFGERVKGFIEKYFEIVSLILFAMIVAGFFAIKAMH